MHRAAIALLVLIAVVPVEASAQPAGFRVDMASADVHKAPSTGSPVIGHASRGTVLEVTRELGSWVKVTWPVSADGVGFVHVSAGTATGTRAPGPAETIAARRGAVASPASASDIAATPRAAGSLPTTYVMPPAHVIGLGGQFGVEGFGSGISVRTWLHDRLGLQFEALRSPVDDPAFADRHTASAFSPSVLFSMPGLMTDYVWMRPYAGAGPRFLRQSTTLSAPDGTRLTSSSNGMGFQTFGGGEFTFASLPRLTVSADLRYGWLEEGFSPDLDGLGFSIGAHWYVK